MLCGETGRLAAKSYLLVELPVYAVDPRWKLHFYKYPERGLDRVCYLLGYILQTDSVFLQAGITSSVK